MMAKSLNSLTARDVMTRPVAYVMAKTPLREVARLLLQEGISGAPVLDHGGNLVGMVSEGDLVRRHSGPGGDRRSWWLDLFEGDPNHNDDILNYLENHGLRAKDVMTRDVIEVGEETPIAEIADLLEQHRIKRVPVVSGGKVVGIVSRADLLRAMSQTHPRAAQYPPNRRVALDQRRRAGD